MSDNEYLARVLKAQNLKEDGPELAEIEKQRSKVEKLLRDKYGSSPRIRYGGSKAKFTMILESFDLDIHIYFAHDDTTPGKTLREIYEDVCTTLEEEYYVVKKRTALRLTCKEPNKKGVDLHIDVVPGRYIDGNEGDVFVHQNEGDKEWLQTNLLTHVEYIRDSGVRDAIRLTKLWNVRNGICLKTFVLELLVVNLLKGHKNDALTEQLKLVWTAFRDEIETLGVTDPANSNNNLTPALDEKRSLLSSHASIALQTIEQNGWDAVFGAVENDPADDKGKRLDNIVVSIPATSRHKPYHFDT